MRTDRKSRRGFSLVELVIVVVIIGLVAAIAVPRISRGAKGATESAVKGSLAGLRAAIDLYAAEHSGVFPGKNDNTGAAGTGVASDFVDQLTKFSDASGKTGAFNKSTGIIYGPYLRSGIPALPVGPTTTATDVLFESSSPPAPDNAGGWVYNPDTGEIRANTDATDEDSKAYSSY